MREILPGAQGFRNLSAFVSSAIAVICLFLNVSSASAQGRTASPEGERAAQVRALNNSVLQLHGQMQENSSSAAGVRGQAATVLAQRAAALQTLIQEDPHTALTFAFSPELLADLAAKFPNAASQLEQHVTVRGQLQRWVEDGAGLKTSRTYSLLKVGQQTLNLHFAGPEPSVKSGDQLEATGVMVRSEMAVSTAHTSSVSSTSVLNAPVFLASASFVRRLLWPTFVSFLVIVFVLLGLDNVRRACSRISHTLHKFAIYAATLGLIVFNPTSSYAQSSCSTTGVQSVAVLLVVYPGTTVPSYLTPANVNASYFSNPGGMSLSDYWPQASYGLTSVSGSVFGWYTLSSGPSGYASLDAVAQDAVNIAANAGVPIQNYNHLSLIMPDWGAGWAGLASIGCASTYTTPSGTSFTVSTSYINGTNWNTQNITQQQALNGAAFIVMHELGHNLGLNHSSSRAFTDASGNSVTLGPLGVQGTLLEYNDVYDAMSNGNPGHYDAPHKIEQLDWIGPSNYAVVQSSGTWTLEPLETSVSPAGLKALKIQRGTGNAAWLWIEYRRPIGVYDSAYYRDPTYMPWADEFYSGALIHYEDSFTTTEHTHLLDFTPTSVYGFVDPALAAGQTWTDPYTNVSISALSATSSGLTVSVNYGAAPCTSSAPSLSLSPLDPSIYPGQSANYSVMVTNNDSSACSSNTINLGSSEPTGWSTSLSSTSVTLSPGQSASVTMGKGAPSGTPVGTYAVNMTASAASASTTGTANATVMAAPSLAVSISTNTTTVTPPSTVSISASVINGGTPASGAGVTFTLTTPNGSTTTQTATASSSGTATWNYKVNSRSQAGTYSVVAQASLSSGSKRAASTQAVTSNTANFTVQ